MTPEVSDFIPGSLEDTDKYIEVTDGHHVTEKKGQVQIQMCDDNGKTFIATFVFLLDLFVLPRRDVRLQLQCIYPYLHMILE